MPTRQTVEMTVTDALGVARASLPVEFFPQETPFNEQSPEDPDILYVSRSVKGRTNASGFLSIELEEGKYQVFVGDADKFLIEVTTNTGTVDIGTLEVSS